MTKKTKKIDTALVGCGYWGTNIAKSLVTIKKAIYVYDENQKNTIILKKRLPYFIHIENNLNHILINKGIKNIILATPPSHNYKLLLKLIKYQKNIFVEKPGLKNLKEINLLKKKTKGPILHLN